MDMIQDTSGNFDGSKPDEADRGSLDVEHIVDHDFELGRDNFGFRHHFEADDTQSGFVGISGYEV